MIGGAGSSIVFGVVMRMVLAFAFYCLNMVVIESALVFLSDMANNNCRKELLAVSFPFNLIEVFNEREILWTGDGISSVE